MIRDARIRATASRPRTLGRCYNFFVTTPTIPTKVPVFPLPGVVLFPRALLPLKIFEPKARLDVYRQVCRDILVNPIQFRQIDATVELTQGVAEFSLSGGAEWDN